MRVRSCLAHLTSHQLEAKTRRPAVWVEWGEERSNLEMKVACCVKFPFTALSLNAPWLPANSLNKSPSFMYLFYCMLQLMCKCPVELGPWPWPAHLWGHKGHITSLRSETAPAVRCILFLTHFEHHFQLESKHRAKWDFYFRIYYFGFFFFWGSTGCSAGWKRKMWKKQFEVHKFYGHTLKLCK